MEEMAHPSSFCSYTSGIGKTIETNLTSEQAVSTSIEIEYRPEATDVDVIDGGSKAPESMISVSSDSSKEVQKQDGDTDDVAAEDDEGDDADSEFEYDSDAMEFEYDPNFGIKAPEGITSGNTEESSRERQDDMSKESGATGVNKEQAKMELFWKLMDMGFSRERTVEAIHEKGYTDVEAAAEYLLTTGNLEGFSVEKMAPKEHKYESKEFCPNHQVQFSKTISREANLLKSSLPDGIYVRAFEDRMDLYSVMIKGPEKTPYEDGLFFFDVQLPPTYPNLPPIFHFHSYSARLNPNLYVCGKVCVSLLGTWAGKGSENWDPKNSNLLQVLVSIQGLILVSEPYYNEPGFASQKGTQASKERSRQYNEMVITQNVASLTRLAENPPSLFHNEVREHLNENSVGLRNRIIGWIENCDQQGMKARENSTDAAGSGLLPDFPLAPLSPHFCSGLRRSLDNFDKSVQKLIDKSILSDKVKPLQEN